MIAEDTSSCGFLGLNFGGLYHEKIGSKTPMETQMLLLKAREEYAIHDENSSNPTIEKTFYIMFLPVLDGPFQTSLQGTPKNEL